MSSKSAPVGQNTGLWTWSLSVSRSATAARTGVLVGRASALRFVAITWGPSSRLVKDHEAASPL